MQRRGRSRQVSQAALARQASEERLQRVIKDLMMTPATRIRDEKTPHPSSSPTASSSSSGTSTSIETMSPCSPCSHDQQMKPPLSTSRGSPPSSCSTSSHISLSSSLSALPSCTSGSSHTAIFSSSAQTPVHGPATGLSSAMRSVKDIAGNAETPLHTSCAMHTTTLANGDQDITPSHMESGDGNPPQCPAAIIIDLTEPQTEPGASEPLLAAASLSQVPSQQVSELDTQIETYYMEEAEDVCTITTSFDNEPYTYSYTYPPSLSTSPPTSGAMTPITSESHASTSDSYFTFASPDTPEEATSPPPLTLHDQLHIAYALEDLPLAKILFLKLTQNIHDITSPNDPRLEQVKPEDFDVVFLPAGGRLMSEEDEKKLAERQERERQRVQKEAEEEAERVRRYRESIERERREREEKAKAEKEERERTEREKAWEGWVENVWGGAKKEVAAIREAQKLAQGRQAEERRRLELLRSQGEERRRFLMEEKKKAHALASSSSSAMASSPRTSSTSAPRLSYAHLSTTRLSASAATSEQPELLYSCMITPSAPKPPRKKRMAGHSGATASMAEPSLSSSANQATADSRDSPYAPTTASSFPSSPRHSNSPLCSDGEEARSLDSSSPSSHHTEPAMPHGIPIQDVLAAMRGPLFPLSSTESVNPRDRSPLKLHSRNKSEELNQIQVHERRRSKTPHQSFSVSTSVSAATRRQKRDAELLASLLVYPSDAPAADRLQSRRDKGKGKAIEVTLYPKRAFPSRKNSSRSAVSMDSVTSPTVPKSSCSACSPTSSTSSGALSRAGSWLSFVSSSSPSSSSVAISPASTTLTTPSTSITSSPPVKSALRSAAVFSSWFKGTSSNQAPSSPVQVEACTCGSRASTLSSPRSYSPGRAFTGSTLIPVAKSESPLPLDVLDTSDARLMWEKDGVASPSTHLPQKAFNSAASDAVSSSPYISGLSRSVSRFIDIAKGFQSAYMQATMFAAVAGVPTVGKHGSAWDEEYEDRLASRKLKAERLLASKSIHGGSSGKRRNLRPIGYRVNPTDARHFVPSAVPMANKHASLREHPSQPSDADTGDGLSDQPQLTGFRAKLTVPDLFPTEGEIQYLPLTSPYSYSRTNPPRTVLPNPLPFPLHFKSQTPLTGSPVRRWAQQFQDENSEGWFSGRSASAHGRSKRPSSPPKYGPLGFRSSGSSRRSPSPPSPRAIQTPQPIGRYRFVANPVYLRVKALQNCTGIPLADAQVVQLHGGVVLKGGALSCGKEKVLSVAFEEVGRSALGQRPQVQVNQRQGRSSFRIVEMPVPPRGRDDFAVRSGSGSRGGHAYAQEKWEEGSVRRGRCVIRG